MPRLTRSEARAILTAARVPVGSDFHKLSSGDVASLIVQADRVKYRAPRNANGSRARSFHSYLERTASRPFDGD